MNNKGHKKNYTLVFLFFLIVVSVIWFFPARKIVRKEIKPIAVKAVKGRIAIVLDDWGYTLNNIPALKEVKVPLTLAVLPNLPYSKEISRDMHRLGFEIIMHMPMEPKTNQPLEKGTIKTSMNKEEVTTLLQSGLLSINHVRGLSNHMGSKATADTNIMNLVFSELQKRKLYFLDSFVTSDSVCSKVAPLRGVRFAKRDIFLDNSSDLKYIRGQLERLKEVARVKGYAIGIGHDRRNTIRAIKNTAPDFEKEGYRFVLVSEILQ